MDRIYENEKVLDLCTGTATNAKIITEWEPSKQLFEIILFAPIHYLEPKAYRKFIKTDLYLYFEKYGLSVQEDIHCDYTRVITLKKI